MLSVTREVSIKFVIIIGAVGLAFYSYLGFRLADKWWEWAILLLPFMMVLLFPSNRDNHLLLNVAFVCMGLISFLFLFSLLRDISLLFNFSVSRTTVFILALSSVSIGMLKATFGINIRHVEVPVRDLPSALSGFKVAQISDLHIGPTIGADFVKRIVAKVNQEGPDLIAFTGDIGDGDVDKLLGDSLPLQELKTKLGSFYVPGNHEYYWNARAWMKRFSELGLHVLINKGEVVEHKGEKILIAGVPDPVSRQKQDPLTPLAQAPYAALKILLSHRPEIVSQGNDWGYDLILAGHTHGGQFFPWTLVAHFAHEYNLGLYSLNKGHIYVSAGTGSWGPRLRLGTTPEITILKLKKAE